MTEAAARPARPLGALAFIRRVRDNPISVYAPETYERPFSERRVLFQRFVLLNHPDYIHRVLVANQANYRKGRLTRQILGPTLGNGLLTSEGEFWRRQRRIEAPAFHHRRLAGLAGLMVEVAEGVSARWRGRPEIDVGREMMALTMEIVARALFSRDIAGSVGELGAAIGVLIESFGKAAVADLLGLPEWLPRRRDPEAKRALAYVDSVIYEIIRSRRAAPEAPGDLLLMLLEARDEETGEGMTDRQLRDEVMTLFAAGHETTAVALTWCWHLLGQHPEVEARLHGEIDAALAGRSPAFEDLERMPYGRMVVEETLRLYPPAYSFNREALADDWMGPHRVPRGALVTLSPWVTHRNPALWPEPLRFDPERFAPEQARERPRYAYFPFGGGPRICIGAGFAMMEARLALAVLARDWRLVPPPGPAPRPQARVTLRPREPLLMRPEPRRL